MPYRIEILAHKEDGRGLKIKKTLHALGKDADVRVVDVYTSESSVAASEIFAASLANPVTQAVNQTPTDFDWALEIGYLPGVTDNIGHTATELLKLAGANDNDTVYSSKLYLIKGNLTQDDVEKLAAMISNKLEDVAAKVNAKTPGAVDAAALQAVEVTKTHIAFAVNPANPVKELTHAQIVDILTGKITNWKQVGGEDKAILVATEVPTGGLRTTVEKDMLGGAQISANKREVVNGTMIGKVVAQAPEALGVMGAGSVTAAVRELKLDKVDDIELYYVTKGAPSPAAQKLIDATKKNVK